MNCNHSMHGGMSHCSECCEDEHDELYKQLRETKAQLAAKDEELRGVREALERAHSCATVRDDGTCDGCFVAEALRGHDN